MNTKTTTVTKRSIAHVVGWLAVIATVSAVGTAAATLPGKNTVDSGDIINGEVKRADLSSSSVNSSKVKDGTLRSIDIMDGTLTSDDLASGSVGASELAPNSVGGADVLNNSLTGFDIANGSLTGTDIAANSVGGSDIASNSLTGSDIRESSLNLGNFCATGLIHSWALVKGSSSMPGNYTTSRNHVDVVHNCSGQSVQVKRNGTGRYSVRFNGDGAWLAQVTPYSAFGGADNTASVRKSGSDFIVDINDAEPPGEGPEDGWFVITTF